MDEALLVDALKNLVQHRNPALWARSEYRGFPYGSQAVAAWGWSGLFSHRYCRWNGFAANISWIQIPKRWPSTLSPKDDGQPFAIRSPATPAASLAAYIKLIGFHIARKLFSIFADRTAAQLLKPTPCGAVTTQAQKILQINGIDSGFSRCQPPHRFKPLDQRFSGSVKNRTGSNGMLMLASLTNIETSGTLPATIMSALAAGNGRFHESERRLWSYKTFDCFNISVFNCNNKSLWYRFYIATINFRHPRYYPRLYIRYTPSLI